MKSKKLSIIAAVLIATSGLTNCGNNGCEEVREAYCLASLQSRSGTNITEMRAWGLGQVSKESNDSVIITDMMTSAASPSEIELKLNPNDSVTRVLMAMRTSYYGTNAEATDTLTIRYQVDPHFIDMECGCTLYFTLTSVETTHNLFRSAAIKNDVVTNETTTNLQIEY